MRELAEDESVQVIILQLINVRYLDGSVCWALLQVEAYLKKKGILLLFSGVNPAIDQVFHSSGLKKKLGENRFFISNDQVPSEPTRKAYAYAKSVIK